ncbi:MAG: DUF374 domain-containing protein [Pseudomonadota bacterium]
MIKTLGKSPAVQRVAGHLIGGYLKLCAATSRLELTPADFPDQAEADVPFILTAWHGEHLLLPMLNRTHYQMKALVSRHRDGELNAIALKWFGVDTIRGAGSHNRDIFRKGAFQAFRGLMGKLESGSCVFMTGDVPKTARVASPGVIRLAAHTGRAIYPVGIAAAPNIATSGWDRAAAPLPFSRIGIALDGVLRVPQNADEATQEAACKDLQGKLERASAKAWASIGAECPYHAALADAPNGEGAPR